MTDSKVYMFPDKQESPLATAALMNGGMNGMWNNPLTNKRI